MEVEMILIAVIILLVLYFVWKHYTRSSADDEKTPVHLPIAAPVPQVPVTSGFTDALPYEDYNEHIINQVFGKSDFARHAEFSNNAPSINTYGLRTQRTDRQDVGAWSVFPPKYEAREDNPNIMSVASDRIGYYSR